MKFLKRKGRVRMVEVEWRRGDGPVMGDWKFSQTLATL